jgi:hypothetical protein
VVSIDPDSLGLRRGWLPPYLRVADADKAAEWLAANVCEKEWQAGYAPERGGSSGG